MSDFSRLLRGSRFASVAKPLSKSKGKHFPTHQVIETRPAALARQEWGLKYALPSKIKSHYITFNDVDTLERVVDFETNGADHWRRLRFQETGAVPELEDKKSANPLFKETDYLVYNRSKKLEDIQEVLQVNANDSKKKVAMVMEALKGLRSEFKEFMIKNYAIDIKQKTFNAEKHMKPALEFLNQYKNEKNVNTLESLRRSKDDRFAGFGGISYALKGRLRTSPNGVAEKQVVPGRIIGDGSYTKSVAIGGFMAETPAGSLSTPLNYLTRNNKKTLETSIPFVASTAKVKRNGHVTIEAFAANRSLDREAIGAEYAKKPLNSSMRSNVRRGRQKTTLENQSIEEILNMVARK